MTALPKDELIAMKKRIIANMSKEEQQRLLDEACERAVQRDREQFHQQQMDLYKQEQTQRRKASAVIPASP